MPKREATPTPRNPAFVTTHWSVVLAAGQNNADTQARLALERLSQSCWFPLYSYIRRRGHSPQDAEDLTQEFFCRLLEHHWLEKADPARGRFRSFLLMAVNRFLANEWDKRKAQRRGGAAQSVPIALEDAESRFALQPATSTHSPELVYDQEWALSLIENVLRGLREEYAAQGKAALFDTLKPCLIGSRETQPYAVLAESIGMSQGAIKVAVCRLRERYREALKEAVADTVADPADIDAELRHLFRVLARR